MKIRGVVFDLDATLVNLGEHVEWDSAKEAAKAAYIACGCSLEAVQRCDSRGLHDFLNKMSAELEASYPERARSINAAAYREIDRYEMNGVPRCSPLPHVAEALEALRAQGVKMSVCTTNSREVGECILRNLKLDHYFTVVVGRSPDMRLKPHAEPVEACLKAMGVKPREATMVGDSHKDIEAGKAAGTWTIAVPVRFTRMSELERNPPDVVIHSISELPEALRRLEEAEV